MHYSTQDTGADTVYFTVSLGRHEYFHPIGQKPSNMKLYYRFQVQKYPQVRIQSDNAQGAVRMIHLTHVCIKVGRANHSQTGNLVPYYLFNYGNTENIY